MAWHNVRRNALMGNDPEKISNTQKTNQRATNETRKEVLKSYADITIYTIGPTRQASLIHVFMGPFTSKILMEFDPMSDPRHN